MQESFIGRFGLRSTKNGKLFHNQYVQTRSIKKNKSRYISKLSQRLKHSTAPQLYNGKIRQAFVLCGIRSSSYLPCYRSFKPKPARNSQARNHNATLILSPYLDELRFRLKLKRYISILLNTTSMSIHFFFSRNFLSSERHSTTSTNTFSRVLVQCTQRGRDFEAGTAKP